MDMTPYVVAGDADGNVSLFTVSHKTLRNKRVAFYPAHPGQVTGIHKLPEYGSGGGPLNVATSGRFGNIKVWKIDKEVRPEGYLEAKYQMMPVADIRTDGPPSACLVIKGRTGQETEQGFSAICSFMDGTVTLVYTELNKKGKQSKPETTFSSRIHGSTVSPLAPESARPAPPWR